jgi:NAD(P)-dependent dehydrogenase (short-subunit alcohol dehydrogenase family)
MKLNGKVFVVTGGGAGIGRATVLELLGRGASVAAIDLNEESLAETARLASAGERLSVHPLDITDRERVLALPEAVAATHGRIDGLINVAGIIQPFVDVVDLDFATVERVMNVNFWGTVNTVKAFLPALLERPEAALVNVSSMGALIPVPGQSAYGASKAAVRLFTEGLYAELADTPVAVTEVFPGAVATDITTNSGVDRPRTAADDEALAKTTSPQEAARRIADAIAKRRFRLLIGRDARIFDVLNRVLPRRGIQLVAKKMSELTAE